tara:strand:+ start:74 stop:259 length:186 start_codon:yes stop_codon:yes gene_type:complete
MCLIIKAFTLIDMTYIALLFKKTKKTLQTIPIATILISSTRQALKARCKWQGGLKDFVKKI